MRRLLRLGGTVFGVAATAYFLTFTFRTLARYDLQTLWSTRMVAAMLGAALAYASIIPIASWAWGVLLRDIGVQIPPLQLNMILGVTQIAKYLPGNIGQHLGRTAMSIQRGMQPGFLFATLAVELLLAVAAATTVGGLALLVSLHDPSTLRLRGWPVPSLAAIGLVAALAGMLAIRNLSALIHKFAPGISVEAVFRVPSALALRAAFGAYALNYVLIGTSLYAIAFVIGGVPPSALPLFVGVFALSWVAGFLAPGAPAGLGVREGVMIVLLSPPLNAANALNVVVAFRIATTVGDLLGLAWGGSIYFLQSRDELPPPASVDARSESQRDT